jgi:hypothetical protein
MARIAGEEGGLHAGAIDSLTEVLVASSVHGARWGGAGFSVNALLSTADGSALTNLTGGIAISAISLGDLNTAVADEF